MKACEWCAVFCCGMSVRMCMHVYIYISVNAFFVGPAHFRLTDASSSPTQPRSSPASRREVLSAPRGSSDSFIVQAQSMAQSPPVSACANMCVWWGCVSNRIAAFIFIILNVGSRLPACLCVQHSVCARVCFVACAWICVRLRVHIN